MRRADFEARLNDAIQRTPCLLLQGLPRVGRSTLVEQWAETRDDVIFCTPDALVSEGPIIAIVDHVDVASTAQIIDTIRNADKRTRFLIIPIDLHALVAIQRALVGTSFIIELEPLSPEDLSDSNAPVAKAIGATAIALAEPELTDIPRHSVEHSHWLRGGLPESHSHDVAQTSLEWRNALLEGLLARDYSYFNLTPGSRLSDVLKWLAYRNGSEFSSEKCKLPLKKSEIDSAVFVLQRLGLVRNLENFALGRAESATLMPKLYIRDSGLLHSVHGIATVEQLRAHEGVGDSWEGYVIEMIVAECGNFADPQFYRALDEDKENGENEIDLVLDFSKRGGPIVAIECKVSPNKEPRPGFYRASAAIAARDGFTVHSGATSRTDVEVHRLTLADALQRVRNICDQLR